MAYAAVISLKQTLNGLLSSSRISTREILQFAYNETTSLQKILERFNEDSSRDSSLSLDDLEGQMRDSAHQLEDVVEFYELCSNYEDDGEVRQEITSFVETVKKMEVEYVQELSKPAADEDDVAAVSSSNIDFGDEMMVGHAREFLIIRDDHLLQRMRPDDLCFFSVHGEVGSGRLYIVKTLFDELCKGEEQCFKCCAWVTIGEKYRLKEVVIRILAQVDSLAGDYEMLISLEDDEKLWNYLCKALEHRRYMIVLEDVHDVKLLDCLRRSLPDRSNGSVVLLTTSSEEVSQLADSQNSFETPRGHHEESVWFCLRLLIFGVEPISAELEEAGKKIVENCRGLLISVAKTFMFLYKTEKSLEQWSKIAADKENPIFIVGDEISELCKIKTEMQSTGI